VVGLDTSGSVSDAVLSLFAAEIAGIARRSGAETHVLSFDEEVHDRVLLRGGDIRPLLETGGLQRDGGTSFIGVLDEATSLAPSIVVILSDLLGAFGRPPPVPVLWATPNPEAPTPPFGTVLSLTG
jgi:predicted metal-dependent peptidase